MAHADIAASCVSPGRDGTTRLPAIHALRQLRREIPVYARAPVLLCASHRRSSAATATIFGIEDRGQLRPGAFADIAVFDPATYAGRATYEQPELTAMGMRYVLVNGEVAVEGGEIAGAAAGRALVKRPAASCQ